MRSHYQSTCPVWACARSREAFTLPVRAHTPQPASGGPDLTAPSSSLFQRGRSSSRSTRSSAGWQAAPALCRIPEGAFIFSSGSVQEQHLKKVFSISRSLSSPFQNSTGSKEHRKRELHLLPLIKAMLRKTGSHKANPKGRVLFLKTG